MTIKENYENIEVLTNDSIIKQYIKNQTALSTYTKKWKWLISFSRSIRIIMWLLLPISVIVGWTHASNQDKNIFLTIISALGYLCATIVASGAIVLILKPLFYCIRRSMRPLSEKMAQLQAANRTLETVFIAQNTPVPLPKLNKAMYEANPQKLSFESLVNKYKALSIKRSKISSEIRQKRIQREISAEWSWITSALLVLIFIGCIALFILSIYLVLVVLGVVIFLGLIISFLGSNRDYTPANRNNERYLYQEPYKPKVDKPSLFESLFDKLGDISYGRFSKLGEELKIDKNSIIQLKKEQSQAYRLLNLYIPQLQNLHIHGLTEED